MAFYLYLTVKYRVLTRNNDPQTLEGIFVFLDADTYIRNSQITVSGNSTGDVLGINGEDAGLIQVFDTTLEVGEGNLNTMGINLDRNHGLELVNVKVDAQGGTSNNYGIYEHKTPMTIRDSTITARGGSYAYGIYFWDPSEAVDQEVTQTVIKAEGATPTGSTDPVHNSNYGVYIHSGGDFKFIRDTIQVQPDSPDPAIFDGGVGILNEDGVITFESGTINDKQHLLLWPSFIYTTSEPRIIFG